MDNLTSTENNKTNKTNIINKETLNNFLDNSDKEFNNLYNRINKLREQLNNTTLRKKN